MSFTIYTAGDATFLAEVFNSVAMVAGSGAIASAAGIGALITCLILGFRAILEGGRSIRFEELLLGFIVYMGAFYPTTTVLVEDGYTGHVHPVDNVPFGPAAAGWVVSSIGYKLTSIFETGYRFSAHGSNDSLHRFAEPLELLIGLRSAASNPMLMTAWNQQLGPYADVRRSWENYFKECTLVAVDLGLTSIDKIIHGKTLEATKFSSEVYGTQLFMGEKGGTEHTCAEAHELLSQAVRMNTTSGTPGDQLLAELITKGVSEDDWGASQSAIEKMDGASSQILGYAVDVQEYMQAAILQPVFDDAVEGKYLDSQDVGAAIAFRQSLTQRNTQWAQEASAFMTVIRPAMTFFEGFVYAVTPMLAMLLVMGRFGMGLAGKYLQTIFWVQLWLPILSICNLYIRNAAEKQVMGLFAAMDRVGAINYESFYMANNIPEVAESWLAVGSMLAASTPMLSFFLISGSSYAFSNIAGRLGGQDHFDEKLVTPDAAKVGAANDVAALRSHTMGGGGGYTDSDAYLPTTSVSQEYGNAVEHARQDMQAAQVGFQNVLSKALTSTAGTNSAFSVAQGWAQAGVFNMSNSSSLNSQEIDRIAKSFGVDTSEVQNHVASVGIEGSLGIPGKLASLKTSMASREGWSADKAQKYSEAIGAEATTALGKGMSAELNEQLANTFAVSGVDSYVSGMSSEDKQQLQETSQKLDSSSKTYSEVSRASEGMQSNQSYNHKQVARALLTSGGAGYLAGLVDSDPDLRSYANQSMDTYQRVFGMDENQARVAGEFNAVMNKGTAEQKFAAVQMMADATAGRSAPPGQRVDNSDLPGVDHDSVQRRAIGGVQGAKEMSQQKPGPLDLNAPYSARVAQIDTAHSGQKAAMRRIEGDQHLAQLGEQSSIARKNQGFSKQVHNTAADFSAGIGAGIRRFFDVQLSKNEERYMAFERNAGYVHENYGKSLDSFDPLFSKVAEEVTIYGGGPGLKLLQEEFYEPHRQEDGSVPQRVVDNWSNLVSSLENVSGMERNHGLAHLNATHQAFVNAGHAHDSWNSPGGVQVTRESVDGAAAYLDGGGGEVPSNPLYNSPIANVMITGAGAYVENKLNKNPPATKQKPKMPQTTGSFILGAAKQAVNNKIDEKHGDEDSSNQQSRRKRLFW